MTGRCLTRTGQPLQAITILRGALDQFDETQARDKALYMSWLAEAYLDAGEIDAAAETAGHATASVADLLGRVPRVTPGL